MARPIQTIPQGLLGLLQLKELGVNPAELLSTVQPSYDLFSHYAERLAQSEIGLYGAVPVTAADATPGLKSFSPIAAVVPQTETWWVLWASCSLTSQLAPTDFVRAVLTWGLPNTGGPYPIGPATADVTSARTRNWYGESNTRPFWAPPGSIFQVQVYDIAGTHGFALQLRAARIPI